MTRAFGRRALQETRASRRRALDEDLGAPGASVDQGEGDATPRAWMEDGKGGNVSGGRGCRRRRKRRKRVGMEGGNDKKGKGGNDEG